MLGANSVYGTRLVHCSEPQMPPKMAESVSEALLFAVFMMREILI